MDMKNFISKPRNLIKY